ncbi:hypothetical protein FQ185_23460 [Pseudomonas sp. ANT_H12B]|nr:hypothetical protein FQ185_23460 [Pseudomonas sp. ANT_H12B]
MAAADLPLRRPGRAEARLHLPPDCPRHGAEALHSWRVRSASSDAKASRASPLPQVQRKPCGSGLARDGARTITAHLPHTPF